MIELLSLFPELDVVVKNAKIGKLAMILPDLVDAFGEDSDVSLLLNPINAPEEHV